MRPRRAPTAGVRPLNASVRCHVRAAFSFAIITLLISAKVTACGCSKQTAEWHPAVDENADVIFIGKVVKVSKPNPVGIVIVRFQVLEAQRGVHGKFITIEVHNKGTSCDLEKASFETGAKYLMSGFKSGVAHILPRNADPQLTSSVRYYNNYCSLRVRLS